MENWYYKLKSKILESNHIKNISWSILEVVIVPFIMVLATPLFIKKLGASHYGIWVLLNSIIASISFLNGGLGDSTIKFVSKYYAKNDFAGLNRIINSIIGLFLIIISVFISVSFLISFLFPYFNFVFDFSPADLILIRKAIPIITLTFGLRFLSEIFLSIFKGIERYDIASKLGILSKGSIILVNILFALLGNGLFSIILSSTFTILFWLIIQFKMLINFFPELKVRPSLNKTTNKEILNFSAWSFALGMLGTIGAQMDKFIVTGFGGVEILSYYNIGLMVATQLHGIFIAATSWVFPLVNRKLEKNEPTEYIYAIMQDLTVVLGSILILCIYLFKDSLIVLWLGPAIAENSLLFIDLFLIYELILVTTIIPYFYFNGTGNIKIITMLTGLTLVSTLLLMAFLYQYFDNSGFILGRILSLLIVNPIIFLYLSSKVLKDNKRLTGLKVQLPGLIIMLILYFQNWYLTISLGILLIYIFKIFFWDNLWFNYTIYRGK